MHVSLWDCRLRPIDTNLGSNPRLLSSWVRAEQPPSEAASKLRISDEELYHRFVAHDMT